MKLLENEHTNKVSGGVLILAGPAWAAIGAAVAATDASIGIATGFEKGFESRKSELKEQNGWN